MWTLFRKRRPGEAEGPAALGGPAIPTPARVPDGTRIYAFGDVHGRLDLLDLVAASVARDLAAAPVPRAVVVGLGDYVDRGADSRGVIARLGERLRVDAELVALKGNHEELLLRFLDEPVQAGPHWLHLGGAQTLESYGVRAITGRPRPDDFRRLRDALVRAMPVEHIIMLGRLPTSHVEGDYFFAHAGARPGIPLDAQSTADLLWIRDGFVDRDHPFEKVVVHGHTPVIEPTILRHRINLDTGAYATNRLSCIVLEGGERTLLTTAPKPALAVVGRS